MVRWSSSGISPFRFLGGRSALLTFVRVKLLFPSDCETAEACTFPFPESFWQPKLPYSLSAIRLNLPKNTLRWLAFVGFRRCYPPGAGSGPLMKQAFTCAVRFAAQLSSARLPLQFRAALYRSPDVSKINHQF